MAEQFLASVLAKRPQVEVLCGLGASKVDLSVHRLDQCCPVACGNKAYKLVGHFRAAERANKKHILSFGGAWSNHIHALAHYSAQHQLSSTAIVRGLHVDPNNRMLIDAERSGMNIVRVSKDDYACRHEREYLKQLRHKYSDAWIIPEGADDAYGRLGMAKLASVLKKSIPCGETLVVASGTGATVRGLAVALKNHVKLVAALVVQDPDLAARLKYLGSINNTGFRVVDASGRGYGQVDEKQLDRSQRILEDEGLLLDPLYNGKAWQIAVALAQQGERVHLLHSGGVQGWRGFLARNLLEKHRVLKQAVEELDFGF